MVAANLRSSNIYVLLNMTIHFLSSLYFILCIKQSSNGTCLQPKAKLKQIDYKLRKNWDILHFGQILFILLCQPENPLI